jgi:diketogulonate reductase-like aldo/keto reductase|tara:strand:+ start:188 stop:406 length:219 start_codon:yes stop_codon:yes gene_type:complete
LIHAPDNQGQTAAEVVELRRQSWVVMEEEYRKGTLRSIGVCNFEARHIEQLLLWGDVTPAVNQVCSRSARTI